MLKISMIGCGKLGLPCAEVMAEHYDVVGYDHSHVSDIFAMCNSVEEAVIGKDIIFIAVPTPHASEYGGEQPSSQLPIVDFDYTAVKNVLTEIKKFITPSQLVVLISTTLPGTVRNELAPYLQDIRFVYNPYLISMGTVKWDMVNPEMIIIGCKDQKDAEQLCEFYKPMMKNNPRIEIGTYDEAESIKIFYNTYIALKITMANLIQDVAELNGNIDVDVVTSALANSTKSIMGPNFMRAGLGAAGACHPRDNIALRHLAKKLNLGYDIFGTIVEAREAQAKLMAAKCLSYGRTITIVGKSYKPGVPYTHGSASMLIGHYIKEQGGDLSYYDLNTGDTVLKETDVYLIAYWEKYVEDLKFPATATVIDPHRQLTKLQHSGQIVHYGNTRII